MATDRDDVLQTVDASLRFDYVAGAVNPVETPFTTGWRIMDEANCAHTTGGGFFVELDGGQRFGIADGSGDCVRAGVKHRITLTSGGGAVVSRWSHVRFVILGSIDVLSLFDVPVALERTTAEAIGRINTELWELHRSPIATIPAVLRRKALGLRLLDELTRGRAFLPDALERLRTTGRLDPVLGRIRDNLHRPLPVAELARGMRLSTARFHAVFKAAMGVAPSDYVRAARMQLARQLLVQGALTVAEVAERVGYRDQFQFSRAFKQLVGVSPLGFRRRASATVM
jgi:AraC-like DNA-binding protein